MSRKSSSSSETEETAAAENVQETAGTTEAAVAAETSGNTAGTADSETAEKTGEAKTAEKTAAKERHGLVRFLQVKPLSSYEEALLRSECATEVMTVSEWLARLQVILNRKVR